MKRIAFVFATALSTLVLGACATTAPQQDPVAIKLASVDNRLAVMERVMENQSLLELANQVQSLQAEVRALRGESETLKFESDGARKRQRDLYLDVDRRLTDLESSRASGGQSSRSGSGMPDVPSPLVTDSEAYEAAFGELKERRYEQAATAFAEFLNTYPESELAGNAQYWLGEAKYVLQDFANALPEFTKVASIYPDSRKVPDALLKIGFCHYELKNWAEARRAFEKAVSDFPDTTAAGLATQRLERLTREGH